MTGERFKVYDAPYGSGRTNDTAQRFKVSDMIAFEVVTYSQQLQPLI